MRKTLVLALVVAVAFLSGWILDAIFCYVDKCANDLLLEPVAGLAIIVVPCYSIITLGIVFTSAVALRKRFSIWLSAVIPAGTLSLLLSAWLYAPEVDNVVGLLGLFSWLAIPWFFCNIVGLQLWLKDNTANLNGDIND